MSENWETVMRQFVGTLGIISMLLVVNACGDKGKKNLPGPIQGAWQLALIEVGENSAVPQRSDGEASTTQLFITDTTFSMIESDGVHFSEVKAEYAYEGGMIVTKDTESFQMTDYRVIRANHAELVLAAVFEDELGQKSDGGLVYHRIEESQLASKTAKIINYTQSFSISVDHSTGESKSYEASVLGNPEYQDGEVRESISCIYDDREKTLDIKLMNIIPTPNEDGSVSYKLVEPSAWIELQQTNLSQSSGTIQTGSVAGTFSLEMDDSYFSYLKDKSCSAVITKREKELEIQGSCSGDTGWSETLNMKFTAKCLMKTSWM